MKYYFAYGSNMGAVQMSKRCPGAVKVGFARLPDYRWIISVRGYANIVQAKGDAVEGILYTLPKTDEAALDGFEGVAAGCYEKAMLTVQHRGVELKALVYVDPTAGEGAPQEEYIHRINAGVTDADLTPHYVARSIRQYVPGAEQGEKA